MAIAKVTTRKVEWTVSSIVQLSVAGALVIVSVIMIYSGVRNFGLKWSFARALAAVDSNQIGGAEPALESALSWDPDHWWARELLAKIKADGSPDLGRAEQEYQKLLENELARRETAYYGLGVIALKRADGEKDRKAADEWIKKAKEFFQKGRQASPSMVEPEIGLKLCDLVALRLAAGEGRVDAARAKELAAGFQKILQPLLANPERGREVSREGYMDLYAGLGWANAVQGDRAATEEAIRCFKACSQYVPGLAQPKASLVYLEAQRFVEASFTGPELRAMDGEVRVYRGDIKNQWLTRKGLDALREAWDQYCIATTYAVGHVNERGLYGNYRWEIQQNAELEDRLETRLLDAVAWYEMVSPTPDSVNKASEMGRVLSYLDALLKHADMSKSDRWTLSLRAAALVTMGWAEEYCAAYEGNDSRYEKAIGYWKESIKIADSYEANRNIAVVQKRRNKPDAREWFDRAVKAGAIDATPRVQQDMADLMKFFGAEK